MPGPAILDINNISDFTGYYLGYLLERLIPDAYERKMSVSFSCI